VDIVVTDIAVIKFTPQGPVLQEVAPGWTAADVQELTEPRLSIPDNLKEMELL
jgi:acyl CoA:acetate/3-ketoacid CoA transferase beta subunit